MRSEKNPESWYDSTDEMGRGLEGGIPMVFAGIYGVYGMGPEDHVVKNYESTEWSSLDATEFIWNILLILNPQTCNRSYGL